MKIRGKKLGKTSASWQLVQDFSLKRELSKLVFAQIYINQVLSLSYSYNVRTAINNSLYCHIPNFPNNNMLKSGIELTKPSLLHSTLLLLYIYVND